jgi:DNA-binding NarL/FixJ family response regulator
MVDMQAEPFTVAVIEDQPIMRTSLSNVLAAENLNVVAMLAVSDSVTKTLQSLKPDLILFSVGNQETRDWQFLQTLHFRSTHEISHLDRRLPNERRRLTAGRLVVGASWLHPY